MNSYIASHILSKLFSLGVRECVLCPAGRNAPFVALLAESKICKIYYWYEERSAAFFALGRAQQTKIPVAVITTSGTAAGELLPAIMEAYYTGTPLIAVTADRPRRFRGTGAPQTAEQKGLFGVYTPIALDLAEGEPLDLQEWDQRGPVHINVCFEEPLLDKVPACIEVKEREEKLSKDFSSETKQLDAFITHAKNLFVIVSGLPQESQEAVASFLQQLNAPVYFEAHSGLREHLQLQRLSIKCTEGLLARAQSCNYPIKSILRIGGVPTLRLWRDLEELQDTIHVFSVNQVPFSGLSRSSIFTVEPDRFFTHYQPQKRFPFPEEFFQVDQWIATQTCALFEEFPCAEPSLVHALSKELNHGAHIYLGNSSPIREWDLAASYENKKFHVTASRGVNGIDGQISTFLGRCVKDRSNWAIVGDLTALYDLPAFWILNQLEVEDIVVLIINNGGGKFFSRIFPHPEFQNNHSLCFEGVARLWSIEYEKWQKIGSVHKSGRRLIELEPNLIETEQFWNKYQEIWKNVPSVAYTDF